MSRLLKLCSWGIVLTLAVGLNLAAADEPNAEVKENQELTSELNDAMDLGEQEQEAEFKLDESLFQYPEDAKPAELLAFIQALDSKLPKPTSEEQVTQLIEKISSVYQEVADKILANSDATADEKSQATQLKIVAFTVSAQMGNKEAAEKLQQLLADQLANAKTDEEKIEAYQMKLQVIASAAQADPSALDRVEELAAEILENKDSEELQVFGLEVKAQSLITKSQMDEKAIDTLLAFLDEYLKNDQISQRTREKAQELKLASLLITSQKDEARAADFEKFADEVLDGSLSPETRKAVYQMRIQALMGGGQPGAAPKPENVEKLNKLADRLVAEESEELRTIGYAVKASSLLQAAQKDPAQIDALFAYANERLADNPTDKLKEQMIGLKIQGYMLKVQQDASAAKEMLAFLDEQLAGDASEEFMSRIASVKLQVLMMQSQNDPSYCDELEKTLEGMKEIKSLDRLVQSGWGALYLRRIQNIAKNGGSVADLDAVLADVKAKLNEMPILAMLLNDIRGDLDVIGQKNNDDNLKQRVYQEFIELMKNSDNATLLQVADHLQSILDLAKLQGQTIALEGIVAGDEADKKFASSELAGKYFLIDIWSTADQAYFGMIEEISELYKDFNPKNFEIVGINTDEKTEILGRAIEVFGMDWTVLSEKLSKDAGLTAIPAELAALPAGTKVLVDPEGKVILVSDDLAAIRAELTARLGEPETKDAASDSADEEK